MRRPWPRSGKTLTGRGFRPEARVVMAHLGNQAGLIGAADLARTASRRGRRRSRSAKRAGTPIPSRLSLAAAAARAESRAANPRPRRITVSPAAAPELRQHRARSMSERATVFGVDAEAYDRFRPGYPDEIVDLVVSHADGPVTRALEVGAGTGKASVVFAARGIEVIAVEPDRRMSSVLGAAAGGLPITDRRLFIRGARSWLRSVVVDLLFAAAAFHWTRPSDTLDACGRVWCGRGESRHSSA